MTRGEYEPMDEDHLTQFVDNMRDKSLSEIRERVKQFVGARLEAEESGQMEMAATLHGQEQLWVACYEICRRIEASPLGLFSKGVNDGSGHN